MEEHIMTIFICETSPTSHHHHKVSHDVSRKWRHFDDKKLIEIGNGAAMVKLKAHTNAMKMRQRLINIQKVIYTWL